MQVEEEKATAAEGQHAREREEQQQRLLAGVEATMSHCTLPAPHDPLQSCTASLHGSMRQHAGLGTMREHGGNIWCLFMTWTAGHTQSFSRLLKI